jgi:hypothetical protein
LFWRDGIWSITLKATKLEGKLQEQMWTYTHIPIYPDTSMDGGIMGAFMSLGVHTLLVLGTHVVGAGCFRVIGAGF